MTSYTRGDTTIAKNFEVRLTAPLDARMVVETTDALVNSEILAKYKGMIVSVTNDPSGAKNGLYRLKKNPDKSLNLDYWEQIPAYLSVGIL